MVVNYDDDDYSQGHGQIKEFFRALTKDDKLQPYITEHDFGLSNDSDDNMFNIHSFDIRYQNNFRSAQPINVEVKFSEKTFPVGYMVKL